MFGTQCLANSVWQTVNKFGNKLCQFKLEIFVVLIVSEIEQQFLPNALRRLFFAFAKIVW